MKTENLALHAHNYGLTLEKFNETLGLNRFMDATQTDVLEKDGKKTTFIDSLEGKNYPIFATMWHPEYQFKNNIGRDTW